MINSITNLDNEVRNIPTGTISEEEFVYLFGSSKQKDSYDKNNGFTKNSGVPRTILKHAKTECQIDKNKDGTYTIYRVYDNPLPHNFEKMNAPIYKHMIPLILDLLIKGYNNDKVIDLPLRYWCKEINMINDNYVNGYSNMKVFAEKASIRDEEYVGDYFCHTDNSLNHYITTCLKYLQEAGLILWYEPYNIVYDHSECMTRWDDVVVYNKKIEKRQATKEEFSYYCECVSIADKEANIKNAQERYYGSKSRFWDEVLHRELWKKRISTVYKTYTISAVHMDRIEKLLKQFGNAKTERHISLLTKEFIELVVNNANKRFRKKVDPEITEKRYLSIFSKMGKLTINPKADIIDGLEDKYIKLLHN